MKKPRTNHGVPLRWIKEAGIYPEVGETVMKVVCLLVMVKN